MSVSIGVPDHSMALTADPAYLPLSKLRGRSIDEALCSNNRLAASTSPPPAVLENFLWGETPSPRALADRLLHLPLLGRAHAIEAAVRQGAEKTRASRGREAVRVVAELDIEI